MVAAEQFEGTGQPGLADQLVRLAGGVVVEGSGVVAADSEDVVHVGVLPLGDAGRRDGTLPAVAEVVGEFTEDTLGIQIPVGPVLADAGTATAVVQRSAVRVGQRQVAPGAAVGVAVVLGETQGQGVGVAEVEGHQTGRYVLFMAIAIQPGIALVVGVDEASAHVAGLGQGAGDIGIHPTVVPGTDAGAEPGLELGGGPLADEVDRRGGIAGAAHQAIGPVQDVHLLVFRQILVAHQGGAPSRCIVVWMMDVTSQRPMPMVKKAHPKMG